MWIPHVLYKLKSLHNMPRKWSTFIWGKKTNTKYKREVWYTKQENIFWNVSIHLLLLRSNHLEVFCKKGVLWNFAKFTGKQLCQSLFFNKVAGNRLWHKCFTVNFAKFLRTPFLKEHLRWLLLVANFSERIYLQILTTKIAFEVSIRFCYVTPRNTRS